MESDLSKELEISMAKRISLLHLLGFFSVVDLVGFVILNVLCFLSGSMQLDYKNPPLSNRRRVYSQIVTDWDVDNAIKACLDYDLR